MSKRQVLIVFGALIIIFPFLGFPDGWKKVFDVIFGVVIIGIAYSMAPKARQTEAGDAPWSEHKSGTTFTNQNRTDTK